MCGQCNCDNGFSLWWSWFSSTMKKPVLRFNFWVYLIVGILGAGGAGVWVSFINKTEEFPDTLLAMFTFFPATAVASCMEFLLEDTDKKFVRGFAIISGFILFLLSVFIFVLQSYLLAGIGCVYALLLWWLANADNLKLLDVSRDLAPVGGSVDEAVKGNAGAIQL
jgi:uncharacterized membrane protein